jgi:hypothetical protein
LHAAITALTAFTFSVPSHASYIIAAIKYLKLIHAKCILAALMEGPSAYEQQMEEEEVGEVGPMKIEQLTVR